MPSNKGGGGGGGGKKNQPAQIVYNIINGTPGDDEYRVWTDGDGTTHEMNVTHELSENFAISTLTFTGVDAGDTVTIEYYSADGYTKLGEDFVEFDALTPTNIDGIDYYVYNADEANIGQFSVIADAGEEVFVDDVVFV